MSTLAVRNQTITRLRGILSAIEAGANRTRMRLEREFQRDITLQLRLWFRELSRELRARLEIEVRRAALLRLQNPLQRDYVEAVRDALETFSRPLIVDALDGERRRMLQRVHNRWYRIMYEFGAVSALQLMRIVAGSNRVKRVLSKQADEFVFELTDQEIIAGIELRSIEFGAGITAEVIGDARRMVRDGVYFGTDTTQRVAGRIAAAQGIPEWRGLKIARTESQQAISTARHTMYSRSGVPQHTWFSVGDRRVRPEHVLNDGVKVRVGEEFPSGQIHTGDGALSINCMLPGQLVGGTFEAGTKSFYRGEAVEITTCSGRRLSLTPNHPVPTEHGLVSAGSLKKGDQLATFFSEVDNISVTVPGRDQEYHKPTLVEEVFKTLHLSSPLFMRFRSTDDFHGDGEFIEGDIEVVGSDGFLRYGGEPGKQDELEGFSLIKKDSIGRTLHCNSLARSGFHGPMRAAGSYPGGGTLTLDGGSVLFPERPLQQFCVGSIADIHTVLAKYPTQSGAADPGFITELFHRFPRRVLADEIAQVRRFDFTGHVFDLQSKHEFLACNGIILHNCRCSIIPDLSDPSIVIQPWDGSAGPTIGREVPEVPRPSTRPRRLTVPRMREIAQESNISIPPGADKVAILTLISRHFRTTGTRPPQI